MMMSNNKCVPTSPFFIAHQEGIQKTVDALSRDFSFVSIFGTDCEGVSYQAQKSGVEVRDSMWTDRGFVVRVFHEGQYFEHSFNQLSVGSEDRLVKTIRDLVIGSAPLLSQGFSSTQYPLVREEPLKGEWNASVESLPGDLSPEGKIERLRAIVRKGLEQSPEVVDVKAVYEEVFVRKMYCSTKRNLMQSYLWSQGYVIPIVRRGEKTQFAYGSFSDREGPIQLGEMDLMAPQIIDECLMLLDAQKVHPGAYDVICSPEITGLIAHEAFGHGVEMDMFVKERAKAREYLGKPIASSIVQMRDGAAVHNTVSSYWFDDEGVLASNTLIIENGILKTGICDQLSALRLGTQPTGNGKRQSFANKAYTRMTNTFFEPGSDHLDDMIHSIEHGFLLKRMMSGMEDPKNWGIQCMVLYGQEIRNGAFTGVIVSPVIMTGYVPDLLQSITMVSDDFELFGSGACGKGYKEFVKNANGGPYIRCKARLG